MTFQTLSQIYGQEQEDISHALPTPTFLAQQ